jgi:hypothetical protein
MDPFRKVVVKTEADKTALIEKVRRELDALGELKHLACRSEEDHLARVAENIEVEKPVFLPSRQLTAGERAEQNGALMFARIFGDRANDRNLPSGCPAIDEARKAKQDADLQKVLTPAQRAKSEIQVAVDAAVADLLAKSRAVPHRENDRAGIMPLTKRASGSNRIEYDSKLNESTAYGSDGAYLGSWRGTPSAGTAVAV